MKNIKIAYLGWLALLTLLWLTVDRFVPAPYSFFAQRASWVNYTGIIALAAMSLAMILALRLALVERWLDGLDKSYRLHKWLGITALGFGVAHWLWAKGVKWMVGWGWLEKPVRGPRVEETVELFRFFQSQRKLAETLGEWAFYAAVVLMILALVKYFPYRQFFKTHRWLAVGYLVLAWHGVVLMKFEYWSHPLGFIVLALVAGGTAGAVKVLLGKVGVKRRLAGKIEDVRYFAEERVLAVGVALDGRWPGHQAGQFAFVTFDDQEGPHPFTIASAWQGDGKMRFLIKQIGDYTDRLPGTLQAGGPVMVEGPYGRFDFSQTPRRQIWVAGGIGITPFLARLEALAGRNDHAAIDLFYSTRTADEAFLSPLRRLAERARVNLHLLVDGRDKPLTGQGLMEKLPDWRQASVWFCGPAGFGKALCRSLAAQGLPREDFHQELFAMR